MLLRNKVPKVKYYPEFRRSDCDILGIDFEYVMERVTTYTQDKEKTVNKTKYKSVSIFFFFKCFIMN